MSDMPWIMSVPLPVAIVAALLIGAVGYGLVAYGTDRVLWPDTWLRPYATWVGAAIVLVPAALLILSVA
jgi:hypothetical protein